MSHKQKLVVLILSVHLAGGLALARSIHLSQAVVGLIAGNRVVTFVTISNPAATDCSWGLETVGAPQDLLVNGFLSTTAHVNIASGGAGKFVLEAGPELEGAADFAITLVGPLLRPQCEAYAVVALKYIFLSPDDTVIDVYSYPASLDVHVGNCALFTYNAMTFGGEPAPLAGVAILTTDVPEGARIEVTASDMFGNTIVDHMELAAQPDSHQAFLLNDLASDLSGTISKWGFCSKVESPETEFSFSAVGIEVNADENGTQFGVLPYEIVTDNCQASQFDACGAEVAVSVTCPGPGNKKGFLSAVKHSDGRLSFDVSCGGTGSVDARVDITTPATGGGRYAILVYPGPEGTIGLDPETTFNLTNQDNGDFKKVAFGTFASLGVEPGDPPFGAFFELDPEQP